MKTEILDIHQLKKFTEEKRHQETIWSDQHTRIGLICMLPGQEITTHTHHGNHIWTVIEGKGEFLTGKQTRTIETGQIVIVPPLEDHGIRNSSNQKLVIASITSLGD
jgi:quercetin dioxygenase-like cupin family protein